MRYARGSNCPSRLSRWWSAHTGYSYFKERDFVPGESDLDVAIISPSLFQDYSEQVYSMTHPLQRPNKV